MVVLSGVQEDLGSQPQRDAVVAEGSLFFDHGEEIQVSLPCVTNTREQGCIYSLKLHALL